MRQRRPIESPRIGGGTSGILDFVQQLVSGIALGCVYGLIALGFVLVYKATEVVNFAQGDLMMLGGFLGLSFMVVFGMPFWVAFLATLAVLPLLVSALIPGTEGLSLGGTSILIVVSVVVETMKQLEAQMMMRHYEGFIR